MLDIPTPLNDEKCKVGVRRQLNPSSRRLYSRLILGLSLPGRYYFITWTSSPQSPPISRSWNALRQWVHYHRPGAAFCYAITDEGHGVIHMVIRLGKKEKRLNVRDVRSHWEKLHNAKQIRIIFVAEPKDLASYLADQRKFRRVAGEFAWQDLLVRWRWSKGWLPKGFTRAFGRSYWEMSHLEENVLWVRDMAIRAWLQKMHEGLAGPEDRPRYTVPREVR